MKQPSKVTILRLSGRATTHRLDHGTWQSWVRWPAKHRDKTYLWTPEELLEAGKIIAFRYVGCPEYCGLRTP